jgi:gliding motility-associated-like protein
VVDESNTELAVTYQWYRNNIAIRGARQPKYTPASEGTYLVKATSSVGCVATSKEVEVIKSIIYLTCVEYYEVSLGQDVLITNSVIDYSGEIRYMWSPVEGLSNPNILNPNVIAPQNDKTYTLSIENKYGCISECTVHIKVYPDISAPNVFTPNGDGVNDRWVINGIESYPNAIIKVYTRLGNEIKRFYGKDEAWDGKSGGAAVPPATYYYLIDLQKNNIKPISGSVTIVY